MAYAKWRILKIFAAENPNFLTNYSSISYITCDHEL